MNRDMLLSNLTKSLEDKMVRLALAAESGLSTYTLEDGCKKIASKIKELNIWLQEDQIPLYATLADSQRVYSAEEMPINLFAKYAALCKRVSDNLLIVFKSGEDYYVRLEEDLFVKIADMPERKIPSFKIRIDGDTLIAVNNEMFNMLTEGTKNLFFKER